MPLIIPAANVLTPQLLAGIGEKSLGMVGSQLYTSLIDTDINKTYVENFTKKYGFVPTSLSVISDVALSVYLEAVKATNGDTSSAKINEALLKVKAVTPAGTFSFMPNGLGVADLYITKVVKTPDRYDWGVIEKYSQIPMDAPK
jgi:ABC-type branched-subunit amino acid transport system substrate-binding protein